MKTSSSLSPSAEDQAALWAARLDGSTLDAADRIALDAWLAENPAHRTLLSGYCQFSADLELQIPALVAAGSVALPAAKKAPRSNLVWFPRLALAAAAALVVVGVWFAHSANRFETVASSVGQRQTITLADGTRVELDARTSLQVGMSRSERRVRLSEGEAFFTVSKDPARPFTVETPNGSVRVTGTVFNVRTATAASLDVTVVEGSVQVRPEHLGGPASAEPVALRAGDHLTASAKGVSVQPLSASARDETLAWRQGQIVFHDVPIPEALARFARYHARTLTPTPAVIAANRHVGGRYALDDLEGFLTELATTQHVTVQHGAGGTVRVSLPTEP